MGLPEKLHAIEHGADTSRNHFHDGGVSLPEGMDVSTFRRAVDLLRGTRLRLTAMRLRAHGAKPGLARDLVARALDHAGCWAELRGGDVVFLRIGDFGAPASSGRDAAVERELVGRLSDGLRARTGGDRVRVLIAVAHVWSDEVCDAEDLLSMLTRLAPKTDIAVPYAPSRRQAWSPARHHGSLDRRAAL